MTTAIIVYTIIMNAMITGIDPDVALAVAHVESNLNPNAKGALGEVGVYQILPEYSDYSAKELKDTTINIKEGMRMLKFAKTYCKHQDKNMWVNCFNAGIKGGSKLVQPEKFEYYKRVTKTIKKLKYPTVAVK